MSSVVSCLKAGQDSRGLQRAPVTHRWAKQGLRHVQSKSLQRRVFCDTVGWVSRQLCPGHLLLVLRLGDAVINSRSLSSGPIRTLLSPAVLLSICNPAASMISPWRRDWGLLGLDEQGVRRFGHRGANAHEVSLLGQRGVEVLNMAVSGKAKGNRTLGGMAESSRGRKSLRCHHIQELVKANACPLFRAPWPLRQGTALRCGAGAHRSAWAPLHRSSGNGPPRVCCTNAKYFKFGFLALHGTNFSCSSQLHPTRTIIHSRCPSQNR